MVFECCAQLTRYESEPCNYPARLCSTQIAVFQYILVCVWCVFLLLAFFSLIGSEMDVDVSLLERSFHPSVSKSVQDLTGEVVRETITTVYSSGEIIQGKIDINLKEGELIPFDTIVYVELGEIVREFVLSDFVQLESVVGDYYAEGASLQGSGEGYGVSGSRKVHTRVDFSLRVFEGENSLTDSTEVENDSVDTVEEDEPFNEERVVDEVSEVESSEVELQEEFEEDSHSDEVLDESSDSSLEEATESEIADSDENVALITGGVIREREHVVPGEVRFDDDFEYGLESGERAEIVSGSVFVDNEQVDDDFVHLEIEGERAVVSTDYFVDEKGFGKDYLGEPDALIFRIDLEDLELSAFAGELIVQLRYFDEIIADFSREIILREVGLENESSLGSSEIVSNSSFERSNESISNLTFFSEIPLIRIPFGSNVSIDLRDHFSGAERYSVNVTDIVASFNGQVLTFLPPADFKGARQATVTGHAGALSVTSNSFPILVSSGAVNIRTQRDKIVIGKPVRWVKNISLDAPENISIELPRNVTNLSVFKEQAGDFVEEPIVSENLHGSVITGNVVIDVELRKRKPRTFLGKLWALVRERAMATITGRVVSAGESTTGIEIVLDDSSATEYLVEYETPAPKKVEVETNDLKEVTISGPDEVEYTDVIAFSDLNNEVRVGAESKITLYWLNYESEQISEEEIQDVITTTPSDVPERDVVESTETPSNSNFASNNVITPVSEDQFVRESVAFDAYDLDSDGFIDYIEWVVPHLSNQTYLILIEITSAEHLDSSREFISDIYAEVSALDGNWSEVIPAGDYVRVVFEENLTSERDVTVFPRTVSGTPRIEVYEVNGSEIVASFESLVDDELNTVYLDGSSGAGLGDREQDVFDLLILDGDVEFDWIVDPTNVTNNTVESIHMTVLDENTFVMAWCDEDEDDKTFAVYDTDGSLVTGPIDVDTTGGGCSNNGDNLISVSAFNSTAFVVGWHDGGSFDISFAVYDIYGTVLTSEVDVYPGDDPATGVVSVSALNESAFVIAAADEQNSDELYFAVYGLDGSELTSRQVVYASMTSPSVSVSAFNSTAFVVGWNAGQAARIIARTYLSNGSAISENTIVDGSSGFADTVSVAAFNSSDYVIAWHDLAEQDVSFAVYSINGSILTSTVDVDTSAGSSGSVSVSILNESAFVVGWYDTIDGDVSFRTYASNGSALSSETDVNTDAQKYLEVSSSSASTGIGLCNENFVVGWAESGNASFEVYDSEGTLWDGVCNHVPSSILHFPANASEISGVSHTLLNATVFHGGGEGIDVSLYGGNASAIDYGNNLLYQVFNVSNGTEVVYNWTASPAVPDANSVLLLHFDNRSAYGENSSYVVDFSGYGNNGTPSAGAVLNVSNGKFGGGVEFDGFASRVDISDDGSSLDYNDAGSYTWSAWIYMREVSKPNFIISKPDTATPAGYVILILPDNTLSFSEAFDVSPAYENVVNTSLALNVNQWHHVAVTQAGESDIRLYIDGELNATGSGNLHDETTTSVRIGRGINAGQYFNGTIDEISIRDRVLSAGEIRDLYRLKVGTHFWKVNVSDESGNSNESEMREFEILNFDVTACGVLDTANAIYTLQNAVNASGTCFTINADNVTLDGQDYLVNYSQSSSGSGVIATSVSNVTLENLRVALGNTSVSSSEAIYFTSVDDGVLLNSEVNVSGNAHDAVFVDVSSGLNISGNMLSVGNGSNSNGILFVNSNSSRIDSNSIHALSIGSGSGGIAITRNSYFNVIARNTLNVSSASGIRLSSSGSDYPQFTNISNNNFSDSGATQIEFSSGVNDTYLLDQDFLDYDFNDGGVLVVRDSLFGEVAFLESVSGSGSNFSNDVRIGNNSVFVASDSSAGLNVSANVTLYGIGDRGFAVPELLRDGVSCGDICFNFSSLTASSVVFNVSGWSNYSIGDDAVVPLISYESGTENDGEVVLESVFVNVSVSEANEAIILFGLYNSGGVVNESFYSDGTRTINWSGLGSGLYTYNVSVNDTAGNSNSTVSRTIRVVSSCLEQCSEESDCTITTACALNDALCSGSVCDFGNFVSNSTVYTLYNASGDGSNLDLNLSGNITFLADDTSVVFGGRNGSDIGSGGFGGNGGIVSVRVSGLLNTTNAQFIGRGGYSTQDGAGGNGGILQLYFHGLIRKFSDLIDGETDNTPILSAGNSTNGTIGSEGSVFYNRDSVTPRDPDVNIDGRISNLDVVLIKAQYNNISSDEDFNSSRDINVDEKINVIDLTKVGFEYQTR